MSSRRIPALHSLDAARKLVELMLDVGIAFRPVQQQTLPRQHCTLDALQTLCYLALTVKQTFHKRLQQDKRRFAHGGYIGARHNLVKRAPGLVNRSESQWLT